MTVKNKKLIGGLLFLIIFLIFGIAIFLVIHLNEKNTSLIDQKIRAKFSCDRSTQEALETDIFCNPETYRNPELSADRYSKYLDCDNVLRSPPISEIKPDGSAYTRYEICSDNSKFNQSRGEFNNHLIELKQTSGSLE